MIAMGMTSGIGSLLIGAREAGFDVAGNVEWRRYYHVEDDEGRNTFRENFPDAFLVKTLSDLNLKKWRGKVDLLMGHPECGAYSALSGANYGGGTAEDHARTASDIPIFVEGVQKLQPKFFVMDNLPKSLIGFTIEEWAAALPRYHLYPEWVSNYHYGNVQKNRKRFFMIGARRELRYVFVPGEKNHTRTTTGVLKGMKAKTPNNEKHTLDASLCRGKGLLHNEYLSFREAREFFKRYPPGKSLPYKAKDGKMKVHIGLLKTYKEYCHVLQGGNPIFDPRTNLPFSIRARARIMGIPDDFIFYGTVLEEDGTWNHVKNLAMVKQTGKCMPVQFATFVSQQIADHLRNPDRTVAMSDRLIQPNRYIDDAKKKYCANIGYGTIQKDACAACGVAECPERRTL